MSYLNCDSPRVGFEGVGIDALHFLARCRIRRLNQVLSVLSLSLGFFLSMYAVLLTRDSLLGCYFYVICVFSLS